MKLKITKIHKKKLNTCIESFHKELIVPMKCTWIRVNLCYICNKNYEDTYTRYLNSYQKLNLNGYVFCKKCKCIVNILMNLYSETGYYIPKSIYNKYDITKINVSFFRKSLSSNIEPYIEKKAFININDYPVFKKNEDNRLNICVIWKILIPNLYTSDTLMKTITMANIIHHNRKIFGYKLEDGPYINCVSFWHKDIKKEYDIANQFNLFVKNINYLKCFDQLICSKIYDFWRSELL